MAGEGEPDGHHCNECGTCGSHSTIPYLSREGVQLLLQRRVYMATHTYIHMIITRYGSIQSKLFGVVNNIHHSILVVVLQQQLLLLHHTYVHTYIPTLSVLTYSLRS